MTPFETEIKDKIDLAAKSLEGIQTEHKKLVEEGKMTSETLVKFQSDFQNTTQLISDLKTRHDALELVIARGANSGDTKEASAYSKEFKSFLKHKSAISSDAVESEVKAYADIFGVDHTDVRGMQEVKAFFEGSNVDGGYLVPADVQSRILKRLYETEPMRALANVVNTASDVVKFTLDDDDTLSCGWVSENATRAKTASGKIAEIEIPIHELYAQPAATQRFLDDAINSPESWISNKIIDKITRTENAAFISGDGNGKPSGLLSYSAWGTAGQYERNKLEDVTTAGSNVIAGDDLIGLQGALLEGYQPNAKWLMHRKIFANICTLKGTDGQYLLNPLLLWSGPKGMTILGKEVVLGGDMPADLVDNDLAILFGDFKEGYTIADRMGIRVIRDNITEKGFVLFYTTKRTGGAVTNFQAIKRLKIKA
jgi:HK97 family phage major capsid protein